MDEMQTAFDKIRLLMAGDVISAFLDHNKQFDIYTDSLDYQMGACIMQDGQPIVYYSETHNGAQKFLHQQTKTCCL
jgi:hypothetical protein